MSRITYHIPHTTCYTSYVMHQMTYTNYTLHYIIDHITYRRIECIKNARHIPSYCTVEDYRKHSAT